MSAAVQANCHVFSLNYNPTGGEVNDFFEAAQFDRPGYPKLHFIEHRYAGDPTNWFIPNRAASQAMLRSAGFAPAGIRKNYYVETNEDALVMWAHDVDTPEYGRHLAEIEAGIPGVTLISEGLR